MGIFLRSSYQTVVLELARGTELITLFQLPGRGTHTNACRAAHAESAAGRPQSHFPLKEDVVVIPYTTGITLITFLVKEIKIKLKIFLFPIKGCHPYLRIRKS